MMEAIDDFIDESRRPRTSIVMLLIALAALTFSYLAAYAVPDALVAADMMAPFSNNPDPRPNWMATSFACLFGVLILGAGFARLVSSRQLRRIDAMSDDERNTA